MPINLVYQSHIAHNVSAVLPRKVTRMQPMVLGASLLILRCPSQTGTKRSSLSWHTTSSRGNIAMSHQAWRCKISFLAVR